MKTIKCDKGYIEIIDFYNRIEIATYRKVKNSSLDDRIEKITIDKATLRSSKWERKDTETQSVSNREMKE